MALLGPDPPRSACPACGSQNVLLVATAGSVASLFCLTCEHLFADVSRNPKPPRPAAGQAPARRRAAAAGVPRRTLCHRRHEALPA